MEKCNDAVRMYNQAIYYLKQGSDDLAIIQLKKALDNNPDFLDAYNLMTLCCIEDKNMKRAQHYNEIVLKRDTLNPLALHYAQLMGSTPVPPPVKKAEKNAAVSIKKTDSSPPIPRYKRKEKTTNSVLEKRDLLAFLLGIVATAVVMLVLVMPALNDSKDKSIKDLQAKVDHYAGETEMTPEEVLSMREELQKLQEENRLLRSEENKRIWSFCKLPLPSFQTKSILTVLQRSPQLTPSASAKRISRYTILSKVPFIQTPHTRIIPTARVNS